MKKKNYPIKYVIMPVKETKVGENGREYPSLACFIVTKAYVLEKNRLLKNDGTYSTTYKVCCPHMVDEYGVNHLRREPDSDLARYNEIAVSKLYDNYEDAKADREERNVMFSEEVLDKYINYEEEVLLLTDDLEITQEELFTQENKKVLIKGNNCK